MAAETAMIFGHATGRVIVMPPETKWYLLDKNNHHEDDKSTFEKFFDLRKVRRWKKNENLKVVTWLFTLNDTTIKMYAIVTIVIIFIFIRFLRALTSYQWMSLFEP